MFLNSKHEKKGLIEIDLESLNSFVVLSECLNFTKAAEKLFVTQSAFSKRIVRLEEEFGKQLVYRNNRGVFLTADGHRFLLHAKHILKEYDSLLADLSIPVEIPYSRLRVGFLSHSIQRFLPEFIRDYRSAHPNVECILQDGLQTELIEHFLDGALDVLIATEHAVSSLRNSNKILLTEEPIRLLVPSDSPYAKREVVDLLELKNENFVVLSNHGSYLGPLQNRNNLLIRYCNAHSFIPNIIPCYLFSDIPLMVACGAGYAIATTATEHYARGDVAHVPIKGHEQDTFKIYAFYDELNLAEVENFVFAFRHFIQESLNSEQTDEKA